MLTIDVIDDLIVAVRIVRNPDKLRHLAPEGPPASGRP